MLKQRREIALDKYPADKCIREYRSQPDRPSTLHKFTSASSLGTAKDKSRPVVQNMSPRLTHIDLLI